METPIATAIMREFINPHTVVVTILWEDIKSCLLLKPKLFLCAKSMQGKIWGVTDTTSNLQKLGLISQNL